MTTATDTLFSPPYSVYPAIPLTATPYPETAEWGLGQRETDPNALFTFENWYASVANDSFALYWGNSSLPVAQDVVTKISDRYNLSIPKTKIREGESDVFGRVTRAASGQQADGFPQKYLVKTLRPGGLTFWASEQYHRGLFLTIEGFPDGSIINQANTRNGLWCQIKKYENMRKNDTITLAYGATTIDHVVSPAEAAGPGPIRMFISQQVILQGNQLGPVGVAFMVRDVVNNVSGEKYAYSKPYILNSELDLNLLRPPIFLLEGVRATTVDLDQSSTARFAARVILPDDPLDPSPPNRIVLILTVTQKTEYGESTRTLRLPAVRDNNLGGETIAIANDIITSLTDATIRIAFEWQTADGTLLNRSGSTVVRVVGTAQWSALPHPVLNGAASVGQQTAVDPLAIENYTSVTVKYPGMLATDSITLIWMYQDGTQYQTTLGGQTSGSVIFDLTSAQVVHKSVNSKVQLSYSIVRGGKTIASVVQTVTVATIVPGKLPSPLINGLTSGSTLFWKAFYSREVAVAKWPLIKAGQKVWLTITAAGIELKVLEGYSVNADEARNGLVDKVVLRDRIAALPDGSRVEVKCSVAFDEGGDPTRAVLFPIMTYMMEPKFNPPVITHAIVASSGRVLPNGGRLNLASEGTGVNFYWTCDARPYARYMYVKDSNIGGYSFLVPANVTSWSAWTGFHVPNVTTFIYVQESYDLNARSNLFSWTKT